MYSKDEDLIYDIYLLSSITTAKIQRLHYQLNENSLQGSNSPEAAFMS